MLDDLREQQSWLITGSLVVLAVVAIAFSLSYTRAITLPFVLAIFVASIVSPLVDLQVIKLRFSRALAVVNVLLVVALVLAVVVLVLLNAAQQILASVGEYSENFTELGARFLAYLKTWHIEIESQDLTDRMRAELPGLATSSLGSVATVLSKGLLVLIFVVFLLAGRNPHVIRRGVYAEIDSQIRRYLVTKVAISAVTGTLVWSVLHLFGLKLASVFGILAFMLNFIPSIGSIIATFLPIPMAAAQFQDNYLMTLGVVAVPGVIQVAIGNIIEPKLMGGGLKLHPVTILLSLAFWGLLWGPAGMLLAVPIMATIRIVLEQFSITESASRLLAGELPGMGSSAQIDV